MSCASRIAVTNVRTGRTSYRCARNGFRVNRRMSCGEWGGQDAYADGRTAGLLMRTGT